MQLPIVKTLLLSWGAIQENRRRLTLAIALPLTLLVAHNVLILSLRHILPTETLEDVLRLAKITFWLSFVPLLLWPLLAVSCHRILLHDSQQPSVLDGVRPGLRQIGYFWRATVIGMPLMLAWYALFAYDLYSPAFSDAGLIGEFGEQLGVFVIFLPIQYVMARLLLCLPATALKHPMTFGQAWRESRGNGWRLTAVLLAAPAALTVIGPILDLARAVVFLPFHFLGLALGIAGGVFTIASLSLSYDWFINNGLAKDE